MKNPNIVEYIDFFEAISGNFENFINWENNDLEESPQL